MLIAEQQQQLQQQQQQHVNVHDGYPDKKALDIWIQKPMHLQSS